MTTSANNSTLAALFGFDEEQKNAATVEGQSVSFIVGTDEAGRGPGAGPVFAAAACFLKPPSNEVLEKLSVLNDSKKLTEKQREKLYEVLTGLSCEEFCFYIQAGSVEEIEKLNILNTSLKCMKISCFEVARKVGKGVTVLVDGNRKVPFLKDFCPKQITVVKGDSKSAAIAAASILAKVARDRFMDDLHKEFPQYDWAQNKGYLTAKHVEAIKLNGACKWHRPKFLRKILGEMPAVKEKAPKADPELQLGLF